MNKITPRQKELLKLIYRFIKTEGFPPSFEDIKSELNISSNQTVLDHLTNLEKKGFIEREAKSARSIKIKPTGFSILKVDPMTPFLGTSYAGNFTETLELKGEWQEISSEVKQFTQDVFIIEVSGDSMINAQIFNGDRLLIQKTNTFVTKDIVLAQTKDGTTIKRFIKQTKPPFTYLKPENPKYQNILFTDDVFMQGKVIGKLINGRIEVIK